jgi:curved DNA-binding protein CbpA
MIHKLSFVLLGGSITICGSFVLPLYFKHSTKFHSFIQAPPSETVLYDTKLNEQEEKTLYEILNSPQNATREELKRNYIELVRKTHPDAQIGTDSAQDTDEEFQKVAQAWKTLSNPLERKRYDRILRAKVFTRDVESVMDEISKTAGPQFVNVFENVAIPFMRKSAATVTAGLNAVSKDLKTYGEQDKKNDIKGIGGIISNAYSATKKAGDAIDMLDIMEKANELKKK